MLKHISSPYHSSISNSSNRWVSLSNLQFNSSQVWLANLRQMLRRLSNTIWVPRTAIYNKTTLLRMSSSQAPPTNTRLNITHINSNSSSSFTGSDETSLNCRSITIGHPSSQRLKFCQTCKSLSPKMKCLVRPWPTVHMTSSIGQALSDLRSIVKIWTRRPSRLANDLDCQL